MLCGQIPQGLIGKGTNESRRNREHKSHVKQADKFYVDAFIKAS